MSILSTFRLLIALSISAWLAMLSGCATTTAGGAVGANRSQLLLISSEQLEQTAAQGYTQLKTEATQKGALNTNEKLLERVRAIARRIEPQTGIFRKDAPGWNWEVNVIDSDELNAFCMPGGKIMFYSGLINQLKLTDEEIAVVMGHEIAHALREHSREQVSQAIAAQTALGVGTAVFGLSQTTAQIAGIGYQAFIATHFSRTDEAEADRIGLELSARAGYNPRAGVTLWQKMINANAGGQLPEFLSSHPADSTRVQQIESLLPVVMPLYEAARR
ncbi:peptidase M48-like protein [Nitrosospira multiformis]|uniref:Peptidase M48-like protein n=1 Tax=Nitrosospira multiformis TaxID=1231 RepID=A0A2T5IA47_9PROT|nr:M48 family metallopeptidase [Nitrosospira multiformis]PTQ80684.1 peptidase M48-like protein [Nitrosospira multiformis]